MDKEKRIELIDNEIDRNLSELQTMRVASAEYHLCLEDIRSLHWMKKDFAEPPSCICTAPIPEPAPEKPIAEEPKQEDTVKDEKEDLSSFRSSEPEPVGQESVGGDRLAVLTEPKEMTYEELRATVKAKASSGIPMQSVIEKFVPEGKPVRLSSVPKSKWAELLEELSDAK